jgi:hypothetical protein
MTPDRLMRERILLREPQSGDDPNPQTKERL